MSKPIRKSCFVLSGFVVAGTAGLSATGPLTAEVVCQDYGGFPDVGGRRVCTLDNGDVCIWQSVENGVTGGCPPKH